MKIHSLEPLGIPLAASKIYTSLIEVGAGNITEISLRTGLYRPLVYKNLNFLIGKGLVSTYKSGKRSIYVAEPPKRLEQYLSEFVDTTQVAFEELNRKYTKRSKNFSISYHQGKEGIRIVFDEIVRSCKKGDTIYRYESPEDYKKNAKYYPEIYWKKATGPLGEFEKVTISNEKTAERRSKHLYRSTKGIPAVYDSFDYNITQIITKTMVAYIDYTNETAMIIRGSRFAEFHLKIFKLFFSKL